MDLIVLTSPWQAFRAAEAAKKARELVRRKSVLTKSTLPGKLADCSSTNREETEIFLVEGDSAGEEASLTRRNGMYSVEGHSRDCSSTNREETESFLVEGGSAGEGQAGRQARAGLLAPGRRVAARNQGTATHAQNMRAPARTDKHNRADPLASPPRVPALPSVVQAAAPSRRATGAPKLCSRCAARS